MIHLSRYYPSWAAVHVTVLLWSHLYTLGLSIEICMLPEFFSVLILNNDLLIVLWTINAVSFTIFVLTSYSILIYTHIYAMALSYFPAYSSAWFRNPILSPSISIWFCSPLITILFSIQIPKLRFSEIISRVPFMNIYNFIQCLLSEGLCITLINTKNSDLSQNV